MARARLVLIVATAVFTVALALASPAAGARPLVKGFWGETQRFGVSQFPIYKDLGVDVFQTQLQWSAVAPTRPANPRDPGDPAYRWPDDIDYAISEARRYKMRVLLMPIFAPRWANGDKGPAWAPKDPKDLADFVHAASRRYPSVRLWMVWGEPSSADNFQPMTKQDRPKTTLTKAEAAAPRRYARLLDAAYGALKKRSRKNLVVGGNTFTAGDILPVPWVKYMRLPNGRRPRLDIYGHNPFTNRKPDLGNPPTAPGLADFSDLRRFRRTLDRELSPRVPLFLSEWAEPTAPGDSEFSWYLSEKQQASWITAGFRVARAVGAWGLGWIHLHDQRPTPAGYASYSGLVDPDGRRKPGYRAFKEG
jgi:hypothetical protein